MSQTIKGRVSQKKYSFIGLVVHRIWCVCNHISLNETKNEILAECNEVTSSVSSKHRCFYIYMFVDNNKEIKKHNYLRNTRATTADDDKACGPQVVV